MTFPELLKWIDAFGYVKSLAVGATTFHAPRPVLKVHFGYQKATAEYALVHYDPTTLPNPNEAQVYLADPSEYDKPVVAGRWSTVLLDDDIYSPVTSPPAPRQLSPGHYVSAMPAPQPSPASCTPGWTPATPPTGWGSFFSWDTSPPRIPAPRTDLCPKCGDEGEWRAMALVCRQGHGPFIGGPR